MDLPGGHLAGAQSPCIIFVVGAYVCEYCVTVVVQCGCDVEVVWEFWNAIHVPDDRVGPEMLLHFINDLLCREWVCVDLHVCNDMLLDLVAAYWCVPMLLSSWIVGCELSVVQKLL